MKRHYHGWIWLVAPAFFAGCSGETDSQAPTVPTVIEFYDPDTQAVSYQIEFEYNLPRSIDSRYLAPGEDGEWNTGDDISEPWLTCHYAEDDSGLPYQRFLLQAAYMRSPSGARAIGTLPQIYNFDGSNPACPSVRGHYLERMELCIGNDCPRRADTALGGYQLAISREREGNTIIDTQVLNPIIDYVPVTDFAQMQETRITIDSQGRPAGVEISTTQTNVFDDILADICEDGPSLAIALLFYRSCHAFRETAHYDYDGVNTFRETDFYHGWNFSFLSHQQRLIDDDAGTLTVSTQGAFTDPDADQDELTYHFNPRKQITSVTRRRTGDDGMLHTDDDVVELRETYQYRRDGQLLLAEWPGGFASHYRYDALGRLYRIDSFSDDELPDAVSRFLYSEGRLRASLTSRSHPVDPAQQIRVSRTQYRPAPASLSSTFSPLSTPKPNSLTLNTVLNRFDLP